MEAHWSKCGTVNEEVICWREIAFIPAHGACPLGSAMNRDEDQLAQHNADSVSFQMVYIMMLLDQHGGNEIRPTYNGMILSYVGYLHFVSSWSCTCKVNVW